MPIANFKSVYCVSSEDKAHPASNLLNNANKKWRCETPGLKSAYVILQFEKPTKINGIDIGNEHSGFVEASVGKNGWNQDEYQQILFTSSFMTPMESRNSSTTNRVRCFAKNALLSPVCDEKWDLIKILCTQPFNKHVQYGLAFIKVHAVEDSTSATKTTAMMTKSTEKPKAESSLGLAPNNIFAKFKFREDSPDSDTETSSTLFTKWKQSRNEDKDSKNLSAAAAIRDASSSMSTLKKAVVSHADSPKIANKDKRKPTTSDDKSTKIHDRNRDSLLYNDEDDNTSIPKLEKKINEDKVRIQREKEELLSKKKTTSKANTSHDNSHKVEASANKFKDFLNADVGARNDRNNNGEIEKAKTTPKREPKPTTPNKRSSSPAAARSDEPENKRRKTPDRVISYKSFDRLLEGVVFVISGIQNPDRADIREKAVRMGARYKPDWDGVCTHLICAFKNTPKYNQVKGLGKIVKKDWIFDCFSSKKRLPWRRYALDSAETNEPESESEIHDSASQPIDMENLVISENIDDDDSSNDGILEMYDLEKPKSVELAESVDDDCNISSQVPSSSNGITTAKQPQNIYEMDTDEDVSIADAINPNNVTKSDIEDNDNESDANVSQIMGDLFENKVFYFSRTVGAVDECKLKRLIVEEKGQITSRRSKAHYIISTEPYVLGSDSQSTAEIVKPLWVYESHQLKKLISLDRYKI